MAKPKVKLSDSMTVEQFENGYWYASELKLFAKSIGVVSAHRLRKDQLELAIKEFLTSREISPTLKSTVTSRSSGPKDYENSPLTMDTPIVNYCSNKITKTFIVDEAENMQPGFPKKSGVWYWINRWREDQLSENSDITYGALVEQFLELSNTKGRLPKIPSTKFNNFISDFLEAGEGSRADAVDAWEELKELDCPKTFSAWKRSCPG